MKTPREILFERNKAAVPCLDNVRRVALKSMEPPGLAEIARDWLLSMRWHLTGLTAIWLTILLFNVAASPDKPVVMAQEPTPPARVIFAALLENRRELLELTDALPPATEPAAPPPRRSEIQVATEVV